MSTGLTVEEWQEGIENVLRELTLSNPVAVRVKGQKIDIIREGTKGVTTSIRFTVNDILGLDKVNLTRFLKERLMAIGISVENVEEVRQSVVRPNKDGSISEEEVERMRNMLLGKSQNIGVDLSEKNLRESLPTVDDSDMDFGGATE